MSEVKLSDLFENYRDKYDYIYKFKDGTVRVTNNRLIFDESINDWSMFIHINCTLDLDQDIIIDSKESLVKNKLYKNLNLNTKSIIEEEFVNKNRKYITFTNLKGIYISNDDIKNIELTNVGYIDDNEVDVIKNNNDNFTILGKQ